MIPAMPVAESALDVAFSEHYTRVLRYVRSVVRDAREEDLTQETFLRAHRRRNSLRDPAAVVPWLYSIATRVCLDRLRQRARKPPELEVATISAPEPAPVADLLVESDEMSTCVQAYVRDLRDSYRAVLLMHDVDGLTTREIAELLGDSIGSVKIRLHRARRRLQAALDSGCEFSQDERGTLVCDPKD